jgi:hypothetical protein
LIALAVFAVILALRVGDSRKAIASPFASPA